VVLAPLVRGVLACRPAVLLLAPGREFSRAAACLSTDTMVVRWSASAIQQPFSECFPGNWAAFVLSLAMMVSPPSPGQGQVSPPQADHVDHDVRPYILQTRHIERRFTYVSVPLLRVIIT
jgi:hypothetical protein